MSDSNTSSCRVIRRTSAYNGKQGFVYDGAISAESVGARHLCMHLLEIPPGGKAKAHLHENHETAIYVLRGEAGMWYGINLKEHLTVNAGEFLYIPAGVPHLPYNSSESEPSAAVLARTDPNEQESVVVLPELRPPPAPEITR